MTQEEERLLLKDLCARVPYGIIVRNDKLGIEGELLTISNYQPACGYILTDYASGNQEYTLIEDIKPYLRPMSSMTEEEEVQYNMTYGTVWTIESLDWLNAHHFDYRNLIKNGLALEAPKDMY